MKKLLPLLALVLTSFLPYNANATDIVRTLKFLCNESVGFGLYRDCIYTPPMGGYVNNDETEWNNTLWGDMAIEKIAWSTIRDNDAIGSAWYTLMGSVFQYFPSVQSAVMNLQSAATKSFTYPTRTLNSAYQISASRDAFVSYAVDIAATLSLTTGQTGTVVLEIANDSGFTTGVQTVNSTANGNTGTLTIGLNLTQTSTASISGFVPAGKYVRIRTVNTTGTPTFTFRSANEVLL